MFREQVPQSDRPGVIPSLPLSRCVTLGKLLCVPRPQFPHLGSGTAGSPSSLGCGEEHPTAESLWLGSTQAGEKQAWSTERILPEKAPGMPTTSA